MRNCPVAYGALCNWSVWYVVVPCIIHLDIPHHGNATATSRSLPRPNSNNGSVLQQIYGLLNHSFVFRRPVRNKDSYAPGPATHPV